MFKNILINKKLPLLIELYFSNILYQLALKTVTVKENISNSERTVIAGLLTKHVYEEVMDVELTIKRRQQLADS